MGYAQLEESQGIDPNPKPLTVWWCWPIFFPLNLIVGLRQVHFLSDYMYKQRGIQDPPNDPIVDFFPFIKERNLSFKDLLLKKRLWCALLSNVDDSKVTDLPTWMYPFFTPDMKEEIEQDRILKEKILAAKEVEEKRIAAEKEALMEKQRIIDAENEAKRIAAEKEAKKLAEKEAKRIAEVKRLAEKEAEKTRFLASVAEKKKQQEEQRKKKAAADDEEIKKNIIAQQQQQAEKKAQERIIAQEKKQQQLLADIENEVITKPNKNISATKLDHSSISSTFSEMGSNTSTNNKKKTRKSSSLSKRGQKKQEQSKSESKGFKKD